MRPLILKLEQWKSRRSDRGLVFLKTLSYIPMIPLILADRIRTSDILSWNKDSYLLCTAK